MLQCMKHLSEILMAADINEPPRVLLEWSCRSVLKLKR
jgi:hypothetical protein